MNADFFFPSVSNVRLLAYRPWWERGIRHGMTLADLDFSDDKLLLATSALGKAQNFSEILIPKQNHGSDVVFVGSRSEWIARKSEDRLLRSDVADAVVAVAARGGDGDTPVAIGIRTADCAPIILEGISSDGLPLWSVIHAGWRGLACGVIRSACERMRERGEVVSAAVFACGGRLAYEVGHEVIEAIGSTAVFEPGVSEKLLLDLGATASKQLQEFIARDAIAVSQYCTISAVDAFAATPLPTSDTTREIGRETQVFHSFRRDAAQSGRSVTFVSFSL